MTTTPLSNEDLLLLIDDLLELEVLELIQSETDSGTIFVPYMMNDAVEYYLIFCGCQIMGSLPEEFPAGTFVKLVSTKKRQGFIFEMPGGDKVTLWFDRCETVKSFYQYHRIGHFWREGAEHWRMLVYMVGTIHDKYAFLGPDAVNEEEQAILPLVHFGPFRSYSPIDEPLDDRYPEDEDGWSMMRALAEEAGDADYVRKIDHARTLKKIPFLHSENAITALADALMLPERRLLFELIYRRVCEASCQYPERVYSAEACAYMEAERRRVTEELRGEGFEGEYPLFTRGGTSALALEEHPFTVQTLDYEGFAFHIRLMVWEDGRGCPDIR